MLDGVEILLKETVTLHFCSAANTDTGGIVNWYANDSAMTVLSNAPIDDATGLPVPTIAVATNAGISVITDSGSVYDLTTGDAYDHYGKVEFGDNNRLYYTGTNTQVLYSRARIICGSELYGI